jgi:putative heme transporter
VPLWLDRGAALGWRALVLIALAVLVVLALSKLLLVVVPVLVALFLASVLSAPTARLRRHGLSDALAAAAVVAGLVGVAILAIALIGVPAVAEADELGQALRDSLRKVAESPVGSSLGGSPDRIVQTVQDRVSSVLRGGAAVQGLSAVAAVAAGIVLMAVVLFFFLKEGDLMWRSALRYVHEPQRASLQRFGDRGWVALRAYFVGVTIVALIDAVLIGFGLLVLGVPLVLPLAVLTFFAAYLPVVGAFAAGVVAILVAFVSGGTTDAAIIAGLVILVQQLEGNVLYPIIMRQRERLHPLVTILAVAVGAALAGVLGAFLAVPIAAMVVASASDHAA